MASISSTVQGQPGYFEMTARSRDPQRVTLCLHCSTGSSRQWRSLSATFGDSRRTLAPDLLGYGDNPPWPRDRTLGLDTEVQCLASLLESVSEPVDVVAHSFGAAVAIKLALTYPDKIRSLCLYEPVLFGLLEYDVDAGTSLDEIHETSSRISLALSEGDAYTASRRFIDFWSGVGTWKSMPEPRRQSVAARIGKVRADFDALLADDTSPAALAGLQMPVLCLSGEQSPPSTRRISDLLADTIPYAESQRFEEAGHMGPLTHARQVNGAIGKFLNFLPASPGKRATYTPLTARAA